MSPARPPARPLVRPAGHYRHESCRPQTAAGCRAAGSSLLNLAPCALPLGRCLAWQYDRPRSLTAAHRKSTGSEITLVNGS